MKKGNWLIAFSPLLFSDIQFFYNRPVSFNVHLSQVIEQSPSFTHQLQQGTLSAEIFLIFFQMIGQVAYPEGEQGNL